MVAVYITPCANAKNSLRELYSTISEQQTNNPDGFFIIAGDFNHANLKTVFTMFYQHVNFATRGNNTLDFVYTTVKNAYKVEPCPRTTSLSCLSQYADHFSNSPNQFKSRSRYDRTMTPQHCRTASRTQSGTCLKRQPPKKKNTDLQEYTETVTAYIKKYIDDVTVTETITTRANQKPWMTAEVCGLLKTRDEAFRSGDKTALKTAIANLSCGIKNVKRSYAQKIKDHFTDSRDTQSLWQAIQTITDYKPHTCTKTAHTTQQPGALSVSIRRKEDPI